MKYGVVVAAISMASTRALANDIPISYTEVHAPGSLVTMSQGMWDCGRGNERAVIKAMDRMAHDQDHAQEIGATAGCTRTLDAAAMTSPWTVVRRIGTVCDRRSTDEGSIFLADGKSATRQYKICGVEAHALLVERAGERRIAIDLIDLESYE